MSIKTYNSGVGFPSYCAASAFAVYSGYTSDSSYPVANLSDKRGIRKIATFQAAVGNSYSWAFTATMTASRYLQFFAIVQHTLGALATFRICLFSDTSPDPVGNPTHIVFDSGQQPVWPGGSSSAGFPAVRPFLIGGPILARSIYVELHTNDTVTANYDVGAFEFGGWWDWSKMGDDRSLGADTRSQVYPVTGNVDQATDLWTPRTLAATRKAVAIETDLDTICTDFGLQNGIYNPFVYVDDVHDPSSWQRTCFLARNASLPLSTVANVTRGSFGIDIVEYIG